MLRHKPSILVVEDNPEDFEAIRRAFAHIGLTPAVVRCETGDEALDYLNGRGRADGPVPRRPGIVFLDLNLPGTDGRDVLEEIKRTDALRDIPVVVLTTSSNPRDVDACYRAGANSYIEKPSGPEGMRTLLTRLQEYWFQTVSLPSGTYQ
jgi:CheY-like chemotaxis protein